MLLNICLVSYEFPPMIGGEGKYTFTLANALTVSGHNVIVITSDINRQTESQERHDFEIIRVPIEKFEFKLFSFDKKAKKKIKEIYINQSIDILHYTNDYMHFSISKKDINLPFISTSSRELVYNQFPVFQSQDKFPYS